MFRKDASAAWYHEDNNTFLLLADIFSVLARRTEPPSSQIADIGSGTLACDAIRIWEMAVSYNSWCISCPTSHRSPSDEACATPLQRTNCKDGIARRRLQEWGAHFACHESTQHQTWNQFAQGCKQLGQSSDGRIPCCYQIVRCQDWDWCCVDIMGCDSPIRQRSDVVSSAYARKGILVPTSGTLLYCNSVCYL